MSAVKDIAAFTGVSASTVSLVLNNKPGISEATRQRVFAAAAELGYQEHISRSKAVKGKQNSLQFVIYKKHGRVVSDTPFFANVLEGAEAEVKRHGFNLLITYIDEGHNISEQLSGILHGGSGGMILLATEMSSKDLEPFTSAGIPLVVLDSYFEEITTDTVVINNMQGAFMATQYLWQMGHKEIGYLKSSVPINNFIERKDGFKKALKACKVPYNAEYIFPLNASIETAYSDMKAHLKANKKLPTAFFADNDIIALGAMRALKEAGYRIPEDVSVIGFDDIPMCEIVDPPLTTVKVPKRDIGQIAIRRLVEIMQEQPTTRLKIELRTELVQRKSVKHI